MKRTPFVVTATVAGLAGLLAFHTSPPEIKLTPSGGTAGAQPGSGGTRTVDGPSVDFTYGVLSVSVTVSGQKIVRVGIASLNNGGNARSQMIEQRSIPILEQEAVQAQSAKIDSVSGASYTSAGFKASLQAALHAEGLS